MKRLPPTDDGVTAAAAILRAGEVLAYPTETVYGLGVDPRQAAAVQALHDLKGRPEGQPMLLIVAEISQLEGLVAEVPPIAAAFMQRFWPGPLSLLLPAAAGLPPQLLGTGNKLCVRCPAHDLARALCARFRSAVVSTSANRSGEAPATALEHLDLEGIAAALDGGPLEAQAPSTVYDPVENRVLRAGPVGEEVLRTFWEEQQ